MYRISQFATCVTAGILLCVHIATAQTPTMVPVNPCLAKGKIEENLKSLISLLETTGTTQELVIKGELLKSLPNSHMFIYVLDSATAAKLGFAFIARGGTKKHTLIIQEYLLYRDEEPSPGKIVRLGIGLRMVILVNKVIEKVEMLSIPAIAAQAESRKLQAIVGFQVLGISGRVVTEATPMPSELTIKTLMQMYQGVDAIKKAIWDTDTTIVPQVLGLSENLL
jgi:hypothetical protein